MSDGFETVDDEWAAWQADHPDWFGCGLDAVRACLHLPSFTTADVWRRWHGPQPDEPRRMAAVMDEAVSLGWVIRGAPVSRDLGRGGHASFTCLYRPIPDGGGETVARGPEERGSIAAETS